MAMLMAASASIAAGYIAPAPTLAGAEMSSAAPPEAELTPLPVVQTTAPPPPQVPPVIKAEAEQTEEIMTQAPVAQPVVVDAEVQQVAEVAPLKLKENLSTEPVLPDASLSLLEVLRDAYANNPRILAERERQKSTDEQVAEAVSGFRPSANFTYDRGRQRASAFGGPDQYGDTESRNLRVEQPLFRGGQTVAGYQAAKQRAKIGLFRLMAVEQQVLFETITAFMDIVQAQSILAIARNSEDVLRKQLKAAQDRFDVGEVTRTDVAQSEARLSNASAQVITAEGDLISTISVLENLIGKKPEAALQSPTMLPELPASLREALRIAQNQSPQMLQAVHAEKAAKYDVRRNLGGILPRLNLVGTMGSQEGVGAFGAFEFEEDAIGLNLSIPLYQSGAEYARIRQAKAVQAQRKYEAINSRLTVDAVVTQAWENLETSQATIEARADQIKAADVALSGVKEEHEYGARTVLDVLDAEQELFIARSNLVRAERDRVVAVFGMLQALGRLSPEVLGIGKSYDATEHLDRVKWLPIGF